MSSTPFGDHPTLGTYLNWAKSQGCTVQTGYASRNGAMVTTTKIVSSHGHVFEFGVTQHEFLMPTTIARYDRRLGLKSPFFKIEDDLT